ncbi:MAG: DEAD/DEAH box helicase [Phycisphaerae bacterium]
MFQSKHNTRRPPRSNHRPGNGEPREYRHEVAPRPAQPAMPESNLPLFATFDEMKLRPEILKTVHAEGYHTPTPIQAQAIVPIMEGRDLLGCAQTGTGKTAAFALPILHRLIEMPIEQPKGGAHLPRVLVLSPTRELATQIGDSFATYGRAARVRHTVVFGGVSQYHQVKALQRGIDVLVATPGRLIDLMQQGLVNLSAVRIFVLDEADRMLDMGFIAPIKHIAATLVDAPQRQTLLFSATMPREIAHLADSLLHDPVRVAVKHKEETTALIEQSVYMVPKASKPALLKHILGDAKITRMIVFTRTKHGADRLSRQLNQAGINADAIHGNKGQNQRNRALDGFRRGRARVLVATDVAARGLDVDGITHVVNFDLPIEPEAYVHRIGRTGRAGASGVALSFCDIEEHGLLRAIERVLGKRVPAVSPNDMPKLPEVTQDVPRSDDATGERGALRTERPERPHARAPHAPFRADSHRAEPRRTEVYRPEPRRAEPRRDSFEPRRESADRPASPKPHRTHERVEHARPHREHADHRSGPRREFEGDSRPHAPRGDKPHAPRTDKPFAPRSDKPHAPRSDKPFAPRSDKPHTPRSDKPYAPRGDQSQGPHSERPSRPGARFQKSAPTDGQRAWVKRRGKPSR